jgi:hypothetical protein
LEAPADQAAFTLHQVAAQSERDERWPQRPDFEPTHQKVREAMSLSSEAWRFFDHHNIPLTISDSVSLRA